MATTSQNIIDYSFTKLLAYFDTLHDFCGGRKNKILTRELIISYAIRNTDITECKNRIIDFFNNDPQIKTQIESLMIYSTGTEASFEHNVLNLTKKYLNKKNIYHKIFTLESDKKITSEQFIKFLKDVLPKSQYNYVYDTSHLNTNDVLCHKTSTYIPKICETVATILDAQGYTGAECKNSTDYTNLTYGLQKDRGELMYYKDITIENDKIKLNANDNPSKLIEFTIKKYVEGEQVGVKVLSDIITYISSDENDRKRLFNKAFIDRIVKKMDFLSINLKDASKSENIKSLFDLKRSMDWNEIGSCSALYAIEPIFLTLDLPAVARSLFIQDQIPVISTSLSGTTKSNDKKYIVTVYNNTPISEAEKQFVIKQLTYLSDKYQYTKNYTQEEKDNFKHLIRNRIEVITSKKNICKQEFNNENRKLYRFITPENAPSYSPNINEIFDLLNIELYSHLLYILEWLYWFLDHSDEFYSRIKIFFTFDNVTNLNKVDAKDLYNRLNSYPNLLNEYKIIEEEQIELFKNIEMNISMLDVLLDKLLNNRIDIRLRQSLSTFEKILNFTGKTTDNNINIGLIGEYNTYLNRKFCNTLINIKYIYTLYTSYTGVDPERRQLKINFGTRTKKQYIFYEKLYKSLDENIELYETKCKILKPTLGGAEKRKRDLSLSLYPPTPDITERKRKLHNLIEVNIEEKEINFSDPSILYSVSKINEKEKTILLDPYKFLLSTCILNTLLEENEDFITDTQEKEKVISMKVEKQKSIDYQKDEQTLELEPSSPGIQEKRRKIRGGGGKTKNSISYIQEVMKKITNMALKKTTKK